MALVDSGNSSEIERRLYPVHIEEQATQDLVFLNDSEIDQQIGYQTMRHDKSSFFDKYPDLNQSEMHQAGKSPLLKKLSKISIKKNKFKTYPKSCLKNASKSSRFDRNGVKISK